jgi:thiamine-monophosphate kinase
VSDLGASPTIGGLGESGLLREIFSRLARKAPVCSPVALGPGDDAALVRVSRGALVTTDTMVQGRDWRDAWSAPGDVGAKVVTQNLADVAAMGGLGTALLVTLVAPASTRVDWVSALVDGIAETAAEAGVCVAGGDLSSSEGTISVSVTAMGELPPGVSRPVLRSGARPGDVVAVSGGLGRSAAGLEVLRRSDDGWFPSPAHGESCARWVGYHCRPTPDLSQGALAARAGATALIDISDGLVRDAGRLAAASRVSLRLRSDLLDHWMRPLARVLGETSARACVLHGGEEHVLLGTFEPSAVPAGWSELGIVAGGDDAPDEDDAPEEAERTRAGQVGAGGAGDVWLDSDLVPTGGWDHFGG